MILKLVKRICSIRFLYIKIVTSEISGISIHNTEYGIKLPNPTVYSATWATEKKHINVPSTNAMNKYTVCMRCIIVFMVFKCERKAILRIYSVNIKLKKNP